MRRATAVNLVLLGGGLTLIGTLGIVSERRRIEACLERQAHQGPGFREDCGNSHSGGGGRGGGGSSSRRGYSSSDDEGHSSASEGEVARGGFGTHGGSGGGEGGGE